MSTPQPTRVHLITGGYPAGSPAGHDMDYARLRLLQLLGETPNLTTTVGNDFSDLTKWLPSCQLVITYVAGGRRALAGAARHQRRSSRSGWRRPARSQNGQDQPPRRAG